MPAQTDQKHPIVVNRVPKQDLISPKYRWWNCDPQDLHLSVQSIVRSIEKNQYYRADDNLRYARLYGNLEILGFASTLYSRTFSNNALKLTFNLIASCIDTACAKISASKPKPLFKTTDGDWSLKRKAQNKTKYVAGVFSDCDVYVKGQDCFRDACIFGTGILRIFIANEGTPEAKIACERVFPNELLVDDGEALYGQPRQMHRKKNTSRDELIDLFPDFAEEIRACPAANRADSTISSADQICVVESWHLPSGPNSKDGKRTITIENQTLQSEEYTKNYFPFVILRWKNPILGFYGLGLAQELIGIQIELNKTLRTIQRAMQLMAVPRIFKEKTSGINVAHLNNEVGSVVEFTGTPPIFSTPSIMAPEVYAYVEGWIKRGYQVTGISEMQASSKKEPGIESGVAIRMMDDIATERFRLSGQKWEKFFLDVAEIILDLSADLYLNNKNLSVTVEDSKFIKKISWKDVQGNEDHFKMELFPVSQMPSTPPGQLAFVQDLQNAGYIGPESALQMLNFPDIESYLSWKNAAVDAVEKAVEDLVDGKYNPPEPFMNLPLTEAMMTGFYLKYRDDGLSEDRLNLFRTYIAKVQELIKAQQPAAPEAPPNQAPMSPEMAPPMGPPAMPQG